MRRLIHDLRVLPLALTLTRCRADVEGYWSGTVGDDSALLSLEQSGAEVRGEACLADVCDPSARGHCAGVLQLAFRVRRTRPSSRNCPAASCRSGATELRGAVRNGAILSAIASVGLLLAFAAIFVATFGETWRAQSWTETTCEIVAARAAEYYEGWDVLVSWRYEVGATSYAINDSSPEVFGIGRDRAEAEAMAARYAVGATVACFYDPEDPMKSALDRSPPPVSALVFAAVVALALLGGLGAAAVALIKRRKRAGSR